MPDRLAMQDPRNQYPSPPFPRQPQAEPGLAGRMTPQPDHGEDSYVGHGRLKGRRALITGGDSGIGRATAIAYAREGADVAIAYLPSEDADAKEVIALIEKAGVKALALAGDICDEGWNATMVARVVEAFGGLDILVVNAGHQQYREDVSEVSTADFDATMKTNLYALHWLCQAAAPHLPRGAAIITTASIQA
ncbi:MAG: SDR family NAD(P)-dependent oxidoreductase, partial [Brevundimonas sp.]